jgi:imidazolonepropionase
MVPQAARRKLAQFVDVFCDRGAFSVEETRKIFEVAVQNGLGVRAHVGQLSETPLDTLLALRPASLDHMDHVCNEDISRLTARHSGYIRSRANFLGLERVSFGAQFIDAGVQRRDRLQSGSSPTASMPFRCPRLAAHKMIRRINRRSHINGAWALRMVSRKVIESGRMPT